MIFHDHRATEIIVELSAADIAPDNPVRAINVLAEELDLAKRAHWRRWAGAEGRTADHREHS